jgi:hypothetical protein
MKIHLKRSETDHLALCQKWPGDRWILEELAHQQPPGAICKTCKVVAEQSPQKTGSGENQLDTQGQKTSRESPIPA